MNFKVVLCFAIFCRTFNFNTIKLEYDKLLARCINVNHSDGHIEHFDRRLPYCFRNKNFTTKCSSARLNMPDYMNLACTETLNHEVDNFLTNVETNFTISAGESSEILLEDLYVNGKSDAPSMIWLSLEGMGLFDAIP